ncbi:MAG: hypothetical protein FWH10_03940 [Oscillospiraceae bacterium]|nr:hypothetical protein [Oscillospiraceae bacterium]
MSIYTRQISSLVKLLPMERQRHILELVTQEINDKNGVNAGARSGKNYTAFMDLQKSFEGEAERLGLKDLDDVVKMVNEIRSERYEKEKEYENNA